MDVPPLDLSRTERRIAADLDRRWQRIRAGTAFIGGTEVEEFEEAFSRFLGAEGTVGTANGTDALVVALRALGVSAGDEVIVPAFTFIATASAVVLAGGRPVFADVDEATLNLDPDSVAAAIGARTVGILGVHLYGRPFDLERIGGLCRERDLWLLEDAAQAHGARQDGRRVGTFGHLATWSFYPTKNLGAFGDAGAVSGDDAALLARVRRLANHGRASHTQHSEVGLNSRLDALQAAVLNCRLPLLEDDNARRRELARRYLKGLAGVGDLSFPRDPEGSEPVYHQLTVRTAHRHALREHLSGAGVGSTIYYPAPLHQQPALAAYGDGRSLPVAEAAVRQVLSLPLFPELTDAEVDRVIGEVREFFGAG